MSPLESGVRSGTSLPLTRRAHAALAQVRVDSVGKINRRGPPRECEDLPLRSERVDLVGIKVHLERREELPRVLHVALPIHELPEPPEAGVVGRRAQAPLLVLPVSRDAPLADQVHFPGPNLDLERLRRFGHDRRVEGLVEVRLRHRDVVLDPSRHRTPELVNQAEGRVAGGGLRRDDPEGEHVVELRHVDAAPLHLRPDRVGALLPPGDLALDSGFAQPLLQLRADLLDRLLRALQAARDLPGHARVFLRFEMLERQVLELALEPAHAPAGWRSAHRCPSSPGRSRGASRAAGARACACCGAGRPA